MNGNREDAKGAKPRGGDLLWREGLARTMRGLAGGISPLARLGLLLLGLAVLPAGWYALRPVRIALPPPRASTTDSTAGTAKAHSAPPLATLIAHDPFRPARVPAAVAFDPDPAPADPAPPPEPRPQLVLSGIVWGTRPAAIIEGLPGTAETRLVQPGEAIGAIRVRRIERDRVVLTGMDTTWVLRVREPW